jgi:NAD+ diphosphatase
MYRPDLREPESVDNALYFVFHGNDLLTDMRASEPCLLPGAEIRFLAPAPVRQQFLGYWFDQPCFAREIDRSTPLGSDAYMVGNLYNILGRVSEDMFALAGRAQQLLAWQRDNSFCGNCGDKMQRHEQEMAMSCEPCSSMIYPRISPCIIVLVTRGEDMLLARNANFPVEMFSTLAGFIEAGETVEECLVREVKEEVSVDVDDIRYFKSQSWPFPNQLMLGFFAEYTGGEIVCEDQEIAEAHWYKPDDLPMTPPSTSISGQLIADHVARHTQGGAA